jgi:hypothetical protein
MIPRVFESKVLKIEEKTKTINYRPSDKPGEWTHDSVSLGWFVLLEGSLEPLRFGDEKPDDLSVGDTIRVTMEKKT